MTNLEISLMESAIQINNDINGNPRYYFPKYMFPAMTDKTRSKAGLTKYRGKRYGAGYVIQSYSLIYDIAFVVEALESANK